MITKIKVPKNFKSYLTYYENEFIIGIHNIISWSFYGMTDHRTNYAVEGYNNSLDNLFLSKPNIYQLIYELKIDENLIYKTHQNENEKQISYIKNILGKTKKIMKSGQNCLNHLIN